MCASCVWAKALTNDSLTTDISDSAPLLAASSLAPSHPLPYTSAGLLNASLLDRRHPTEFLLSGHWQLALRPPAAHHHHFFFLAPNWPAAGDPLAVITVISEPPLVRWKNCQNVGKSYSLTVNKFSLNSQKLLVWVMDMIMSLWRRERAPLP